MVPTEKREAQLPCIWGFLELIKDTTHEFAARKRERTLSPSPSTVLIHANTRMNWMPCISFDYTLRR